MVIGYGASPSPSVADEGETLQVAAVGVPAHDSDTVPDRPPVPFTESLYVALWPAVTVAELDDPEAVVKVKSLPVPVRLTLCGLPAALSATFSEAVRVPPVVGLKVTLMEQVAPAVTVDPQLFCWLKSPALAPPILMLETESVAAPVLVSNTAVATALCPAIAGPKLSAFGDKATAGLVPVPVSAIV